MHLFSLPRNPSSERLETLAVVAGALCVRRLPPSVAMLPGSVCVCDCSAEPFSQASSASSPEPRPRPVSSSLCMHAGKFIAQLLSPLLSPRSLYLSSTVSSLVSRLSRLASRSRLSSLALVSRPRLSHCLRREPDRKGDGALFLLPPHISPEQNVCALVKRIAF